MDLRVLIHMTAGMSTVDGTQIAGMMWKMALLAAQMPYQANGNSVPPCHPAPQRRLAQTGLWHTHLPWSPASWQPRQWPISADKWKADTD